MLTYGELLLVYAITCLVWWTLLYDNRKRGIEKNRERKSGEFERKGPLHMHRSKTFLDHTALAWCFGFRFVFIFIPISSFSRTTNHMEWKRTKSEQYLSNVSNLAHSYWQSVKFRSSKFHSYQFVSFFLDLFHLMWGIMGIIGWYFTESYGISNEFPNTTLVLGWLIKG